LKVDEDVIRGKRDVFLVSVELPKVLGHLRKVSIHLRKITKALALGHGERGKSPAGGKRQRKYDMKKRECMMVLLAASLVLAGCASSKPEQSGVPQRVLVQESGSPQGGTSTDTERKRF
jgi:hypothetical protein